mmetsp:Transcript_19106/g.29001  ORF Transcript_19106/g.29001 Transcript_19106/m.29001 type:complete len:466 (+) Transcript_19106:114-1511(+)|eukprot:CAMPEP_0194111512 /NCGR_PEP_ID=MMETSP0150-20130528/10501_1 /TAXON_ID=122233 /ORGANISM="Chaetoceros debilis, Strain MM31A-1" /LENGTH=465 /DNA_ID=CAMNT_0038800973 /DNA_START=52 /DNA_END=1449 /DNA_ORIENTATION=+
MVCEEKWWSNPCDNKNDIRYDANISPDISNLNPILSKPHGLWKGSFQKYDGNFTLLEPAPAIIGLYPIGPSPYLSTGETFFNITIAGTRWEQHDIYVLGAAPQLFCDVNPNIPGTPFSNVADDGVCGENGMAWVADAFKTSTHEKNDVLIGVSGTGGYLVDPDSQVDPDNKQFSWTIIPSADQQLVEALAINSLRVVYSYTFSSSYDEVIIEVLSYNVGTGDLPETQNRLVFKLKREEDESTWLKSIEESMVRNKVTANTMATYGTVPTTGQCAKDDVGCPTLETWCDNGDASPLCGPTPYIEETTVNAGVVAGITVAVAVVVIAVVAYLMHSFHKKRMADERERLKNEFARRIIRTFSVTNGEEAITMEKITEEFQRIDSGTPEGGDGRISKAEMKKFIMASDSVSGGGQMKDSDFETLFALIDEDGGGDINFTEFSAFMGHIKTHIDNQTDEDTQKLKFPLTL